MEKKVIKRSAKITHKRTTVKKSWNNKSHATQKGSTRMICFNWRETGWYWHSEETSDKKSLHQLAIKSGMSKSSVYRRK